MADLLSLSGIYKSYRLGERRLRVLEDAELVVRDREIVAVVGGHEEGKTTLLQIAAGLLKPDEGRVRFAGIDLIRCSDRQRAAFLASEIAWIHRDGPQLDLRMLESIALPLIVLRRQNRRKAEWLAMQALARVGAEECATSRWADLSNWERVLVGFARAIVREPSLLIVDNVVDGFNMDRTRKAGDLLLKFVEKPGCSVLMSASPDSEATLVAERVWSFERGKLKLTYDGARDAQVIDLHGPRRSP